MTGPRNAFGGAVALGLEVTWGTPVTRTVAHDCDSINPTYSQPRAPAERLHQGSRAFMPSRSFRSGRRDAGLSMVLDLLYGGTGLLLRAALGAVSTQADTPTAGRHTHTYTLGDTLPSLSAEVLEGTNLGGSDTARMFPGCVCDSMTLSLRAYNRIKATFAFIAQDGTTVGAPATLPDFASGGEIEHDDCADSAFSWNGSDYGFQEATLTVQNALTRRTGYGTQTTLKPYPGSGGMRQVTLAVTREYDGTVFEAAERDGTASDCVIVHENSAGDRVMITLHNAQVEQYRPPAMNAVGLLTESFTLRGYADGDGSATRTGLEIQIENDQATAVEA